jgi:hypothetical protein
VNAEVSAEWRERIAARAGRCCEYCHAPLSLVAAVITFHVEHIMPPRAEVKLSTVILPSVVPTARSNHIASIIDWC